VEPLLGQAVLVVAEAVWELEMQLVAAE